MSFWGVGFYFMLFMSLGFMLENIMWFCVEMILGSFWIEM